MKIRLLIFVTTILFLISLPFHVLSAQNFTRDDFKVALVGQFIKNIEWPSISRDSPFVILVLEDRAMMNTLSVLNGENIEGYTLEVKFASTLSDLKKANLVYISNDVKSDLNNALALLRGTGTLAVTENSPSLHNIMINIIDSEDISNERVRLTFQLNRPNIVFENLTIKPELILHGGSELDVASLYRETEKAMQKLRAENLTSSAELQKKQNELAAQQNELQKLESKFAELSQKLASSQGLLEKQRSELTNTNEKLEKVNADYLKAARESKAARAEAQKSIEEQISILNSLEIQVQEKNAQLALREQELKQKEADLLQKDAELVDTSEKLQETTDVVEQQAEVIDQQFVIIMSVVVMLLIITISTIAISKLYFKNQRITRKLEKTLATLENAQEQLIESEKLASMGQLVSGVAHEINTPIGVVVTSSSTIGEEARKLQRKLEDKSLKKTDMQRFLSTLVEIDQLIQNNLHRCSTLIQNFKQVSADQVVAENREIFLKDYIQGIMSTLSIVLKKSNVEWHVEGDNPSQFLDPGLLGQVINNLVNNAITHAFIDVEAPEILIEIHQRREFNEIEFRDNGIGMAEKTKRKIFEPFFTTKRGKGGTGLGMNIVYNLITSKLGGNITVESEAGQGTIMLIKLPVRR